MNNWRKFRQLPAPERSVLLAALVLLPAVRVGLRALGLRRVLALLDRPRGLKTPARGAANASMSPVAQASACDPSAADPLSDASLSFRARRTARLVAVAAHFAGGTCLAHSIVLASLLKRRGILADLRIGVRKEPNGFEAHAWVEAEGMVLNDEPDVRERFTTFDRNFALARVNWR